MTKVEEKSFMKNKTKYLITTFIMVLSFMLVGFTNVNAATTTAEVNNYSDLTDKMSDNVTDVVKLTSDITLREDFDTTFSLEMSKTLDFNGFTLTIPEHHRLKLIYYNTLDLKFINSNSSKIAKLNLLTDVGATPIYNEIMQAEYTVNFEMDGVDVEYIKDFYSFWQTAGTYRFNNVVFKNLKVTGFYEMVDTRAYKTTKFSNVTKESKNGPSQTFLIKSSSLTVNDVIDANAVVEYYSESGVKTTADRTATLDSIDAYWGPITVKFAKGFKVSNVELNGVYGETPEANISIKNVGENALQVKSVTVSDTDKFEIIGSTQPTVNAGATNNTDFKVKAKSVLNAGEYTAIITVTDASDETYTATVTLNISKKELTGLGISFDPNTWKYGEATQTPTITGVEKLTTEEYKVIYSKETGENLGETQPTSVGKYKATLSVTSTNYFASDVTTTFEIKPNPRSVSVSTEQELIDAVKGLDPAIYEVKLANDITLTKFLNFYVVNDITLELNGQTLDIGSNGLSFNYGMSEYDETNSEYYYNFNSKLTIKDSSSSKTGKILSKQNIFFKYYDTNHDEEIKKFGLTIDGGYYEMISSNNSYFDFFSSDYYTNGKNINVDVKVKDAVFKIGDQKSLFHTSSDSDSDIKFNFNFESLKVMGLASNLGSNKLGKMKLDNVIDPNSKAYFQKLPYTTGAPVLAEADRNTLVEDFYSTGGSNPYIIIKKVNGFEITNVEINETYDATPSLNDISIKNISASDLQIQNVTVDSANFTIEGPSTSPTVSAGATNTDFKVKAKTGLNAGEYTATITVTDANNEKYTATVILNVSAKALTELGINGVPSTWEYGTAQTPTATGVDGLTAADYEIVYSKKNEDSTYTDLGTELPKLVGEYKATLKIKN